MAIVDEYQSPYAKIIIVDDAYRDASPEEIRRRQLEFEATARRILTDAEMRLREKAIREG